MAKHQNDNPRDPLEDERRSTDRGYDEAAHEGDRYGDYEGRGGVFGTTGGGSYGEGFQTYERPAPSDAGSSPFDPSTGDRDRKFSRRGLPYSEATAVEGPGADTGKEPEEE